MSEYVHVYDRRSIKSPGMKIYRRERERKREKERECVSRECVWRERVCVERVCVIGVIIRVCGLNGYGSPDVHD